jgi:hypothetical protein
VVSARAPPRPPQPRSPLSLSIINQRAATGRRCVDPNNLLRDMWDDDFALGCCLTTALAFGPLAAPQDDLDLLGEVRVGAEVHQRRSSPWIRGTPEGSK